MGRGKTECMTSQKSTPFQTCPASTPANARGTPHAGEVAGGHVWKSAHEAALNGLAHLLVLQQVGAADGTDYGDDASQSGHQVAFDRSDPAESQEGECSTKAGGGHSGSLRCLVGLGDQLGIADCCGSFWGDAEQIKVIQLHFGRNTSAYPVVDSLCATFGFVVAQLLSERGGTAHLADQFGIFMFHAGN